MVTLAHETEKNDTVTSHEASTLTEQLKDFGFIVSLIAWYDVLFQINVISKESQSENCDLVTFVQMLKNCCSYLENYRKTGFKQAIIAAKDIAREINIEPVFKPARRVTYIKRRPFEMAVDEPIQCPEKKFEVQFFNTLLDTALSSLRERFHQIRDYSTTWSFLFNLKNIPPREELIKHCADLQIILTVDLKSDIDGNMLCDELIGFQTFLQGEVVTPVQGLNFIKQHNIQELYPHIWVALRILLTIPVSVASGERSFSKLKLIKTYLRSTMSQTRLTSLATLSIENEIAEALDFSDVIKEFANKKARKVNF